MRLLPLLALGILAGLPTACQKGKFAAETATSESYEITVVDPNVNGPEGAGKSDDATEIEVNVDDKDSGKTAEDATEEDTLEGKEGSADSSGDAKACAEVAGLNQNRVKVSGSKKELTLSTQEAFALKVTGNSNKVTLKMSAENAATRLPAVCLFLAGNHSVVTMDINLVVGKIFIKARGNQALVEATVGKDGVIEAMQIDAKGHEPSIVLQGEGKFPCDTAIASLSCKKP